MNLIQQKRMIKSKEIKKKNFQKKKKLKKHTIAYSNLLKLNQM